MRPAVKVFLAGSLLLAIVFGGFAYRTAQSDRLAAGKTKTQRSDNPATSPDDQMELDRQATLETIALLKAATAEVNAKADAQENAEAEAQAKAQAEDRAKAEAKALARRSPHGTPAEAVDYAQKFVRSALEFPDDAAFPAGDGEATKARDSEHWYVRGKVVAKNGFGAALTYPYFTELFKQDGVWESVFVRLRNDPVLVLPNEQRRIAVEENSAR